MDTEFAELITLPEAESTVCLEVRREEAFTELETLGEAQRIYSHYMGDYHVTPLITSQLLGTRDKLMDDDVYIAMIPTSETENEAGGITFKIGETYNGIQ